MLIGGFVYLSSQPYLQVDPVVLLSWRLVLLYVSIYKTSRFELKIRIDTKITKFIYKIAVGIDIFRLCNDI